MLYCTYNVFVTIVYSILGPGSQILILMLNFILSNLLIPAHPSLQKKKRKNLKDLYSFRIYLLIRKAMISRCTNYFSKCIFYFIFKAVASFLLISLLSQIWISIGYLNPVLLRRQARPPSLGCPPQWREARGGWGAATLK